MSALSAEALLCPLSCFCHGACSPPLDLGGEAKQLCESQEGYSKEGKPGAKAGMVVPFPLLWFAALFLEN